MKPVKSVVVGLGVGVLAGFITFGLILRACEGRDCAAALLLLPLAALVVGAAGTMLLIFLFRYMRART